MKAITILILALMMACAVEGSSQQQADPGADFNSCDPGQPGPGDCTGGGGGTAATCDTLDCRTDSQCRAVCSHTSSASCVVYSNGSGTHGFCLDW